jgi:hypothetical protein
VDGAVMICQAGDGVGWEGGGGWHYWYHILCVVLRVWEVEG